VYVSEKEKGEKKSEYTPMEIIDEPELGKGWSHHVHGFDIVLDELLAMILPQLSTIRYLNDDRSNPSIHQSNQLSIIGRKKWKEAHLATVWIGSPLQSLNSSTR
jgi:hypothetical protein